MAVARQTQIIGASPHSWEDAVRNALERANKTLKNVKGVWIHDQSVDVENGKIVAYKLSLKVTFVLAEGTMHQ